MALLDNATQVSVLVHGLDHPEGVAWGPDGYVYAGGEAGQVYRVDLESGRFWQVAQSEGFMGGLALDAEGNVYACNAHLRRVLRITPGGVVDTYANGAPDRSMVNPNYPVFDADGNLYVSDSGEWKSDNGCIFKVKPGGTAEVWSSDITTFPNGLCLSADGRWLYVAVSLNPPRVDRIPILEDGSAGTPETVVELPLTVPDGLAFDTEGRLYISCYRPDRIYRLSPGGELEVLAEDYEGTIIAAPTNVAFCGHRRDVLISANLGRWHLTRYQVDAVGQPLHYPRI